MLIRSPAITEKADRTVLSRTVVQRADDDCYRRGIFCSLLVWSTFISIRQMASTSMV